MSTDRRSSFHLPQLAQALGRAETRPVIVLSGEEPFQIEEAVKLIQNYFLITPEDRDFHYEALDGEGLSLERLREAVEMLPALLEPTKGARLVLCRRWDKADASCAQFLDSYLESPSPSTCLVLTVSKMDRRKAWAKTVETSGWVLEASEPYDRDFVKWQPYLEKKFSKKISPEAWMLLVELAGKKLGTVASEFQKVCTYVGDAKAISTDDIWAVCASAQAGDIFKFAEDVFAGRGYEALEKYRQLTSSGESEIKLLAILLRHFRQIRLCHEAWRSGVTDLKVLGAKIGTPAFFVPAILSSAKRYRAEILDADLQLLATTDYSLKRGEGNLADLFVMPHLSMMRS